MYQTSIKHFLVKEINWSKRVKTDLAEELHEAVVDHEGDGDIEADPGHAGQGAFVEGPRSLVLQDLSVSKIKFVLRSKQPFLPPSTQPTSQNIPQNSVSSFIKEYMGFYEVLSDKLCFFTKFGLKITKI